MVDTEAWNSRHMEGLIHWTKIKNHGQLCVKIHVPVLIVGEKGPE